MVFSILMRWIAEIAAFGGQRCIDIKQRTRVLHSILSTLFGKGSHAEKVSRSS